MITECVFMERLAEGGVLTVSDLSADEIMSFSRDYGDILEISISQVG